MNPGRRLSLVPLSVLGIVACGEIAPIPAEPEVELKVLAWNIWHGGREDGEEIGLQKTI